MLVRKNVYPSTANRSRRARSRESSLSPSSAAARTHTRHANSICSRVHACIYIYAPCIHEAHGAGRLFSRYPRRAPPENPPHAPAQLCFRAHDVCFALSLFLPLSSEPASQSHRSSGIRALPLHIAFSQTHVCCCQARGCPFPRNCFFEVKCTCCHRVPPEERRA